MAADPWDQGGTYTREQLEEFRGPLGVSPEDSSNGNGKQPEPAGACLQCGTELFRHDQKYCSSSCRSRYRRAHLVEPAPGVIPGEPGLAEAIGTDVPITPISTDKSGTDVPADRLAVSPLAFDRLAAVAGMLPQGWRLEASASMVTVTWQA
jgi:hypothetical protein